MKVIAFQHTCKLGKEKQVRIDLKMLLHKSLNLIIPFCGTAVASGIETGQRLEQLAQFCICF